MNYFKPAWSGSFSASLLAMVMAVSLTACGGAATVGGSKLVSDIPVVDDQPDLLDDTLAEPATAPVDESLAIGAPENDSIDAAAAHEAPQSESSSLPSIDYPTEPVHNVINGPYQIADITDLVLLTGQSNALGGGTEFDAGVDTPNERVFAFTSNGWKIADLHQVWDRGWLPGGDSNTEPSNNLALHFGKRMAQLTQNTDRVFGFVLATAPGQSISYWDAAEGMFWAIDNKVTAAINSLPQKSTVDAILWHQGESDANGGPGYRNSLNRLIEDFRGRSWFAANSAFICAETAQFAVNADLMALNSDGDPWTGCAAAAGLPTHPDGAHFLASALRTIGQRYADLYNMLWWQSPR